jgi:hypothetical protein
LRLALELASRAAMLIDNVRLYRGGGESCPPKIKGEVND